MASKKAFSLSLVSVTLRETGAPRKRVTTHGVTATLLWPRNGVPRKEYALVRELAKGAADLSGAPWHESILCRESAEGTFALRIDVTEALSDSAASDFLAAVAGALLRDAATIVGKGGFLLADAASTVLSTAAKKATKASSPAVVASGTVTLSAAKLSDGLAVEIPLAAPEAVTATSVTTIPGERGTSTTKRTLLAKGAPNGAVIVRFAADA
jgi:hypothetical protein